MGHRADVWNRMAARVAVGWSPYVYGRWVWIFRTDGRGFPASRGGGTRTGAGTGDRPCLRVGLDSVQRVRIVSFVFGSYRYPHHNVYYRPRRSASSPRRQRPLGAAAAGERYRPVAYPRGDARLARWNRPLDSGRVFVRSGPDRREWRDYRRRAHRAPGGDAEDPRRAAAAGHPHGASEETGCPPQPKARPAPKKPWAPERRRRPRRRRRRLNGRHIPSQRPRGTPAGAREGARSQAEGGSIGVPPAGQSAGPGGRGQEIRVLPWRCAGARTEGRAGTEKVEKQAPPPRGVPVISSAGARNRSRAGATAVPGREMWNGRSFFPAVYPRPARRSARRCATSSRRRIHREDRRHGRKGPATGAGTGAGVPPESVSGRARPGGR